MLKMVGFPVQTSRSLKVDWVYQHSNCAWSVEGVKTNPKKGGFTGPGSDTEESNENVKFYGKVAKLPKGIKASKGYNFLENQKVLADLPKNVIVIGTNRTLANWKLVGEKTDKKRAMNYYVVNNPFEECNNFLPKKHKYFPKCIASSRTNSNFLEDYRGEKYLYQPMYDSYYNTSLSNESFKIDDYRNPICAAVTIAYWLKAKKIALLCCDGSFEKNMAGSIKLENGLYTHPQHITCQQILDTMFYWLSTKNIEISDTDNENIISVENLNKNPFIDIIMEPGDVVFVPAKM